MASLLDIYRGAALKPATIKSLSTTAAATTTGRYVAAMQRRRNLLTQGVQEGKLSMAALGPSDQKLLHPSTGGGGGGIFGGIGHLIQNLGGDILTAGRELPGGLYTVGKALVQDINPGNLKVLGGSGKSHLLKDVVEPTVKGYGQYYGHDLLKHLYEHPLQPILDVATLYSGGASGAAKLGRVGLRTAEAGSTAARISSRLADITSREGRAPIKLFDANGEVKTELPREYTPRPIAKLAQKRLIDPLAERSKSISNTLFKIDSNKAARIARGNAEAQINRYSADELRKLQPLAHLPAPELKAMMLAQAGINTPEKVAAWQNIVREGTLNDADKVKRLKNSGINPEYISHNIDVTPETLHYLQYPTPEMAHADQLWNEFLARWSDRTDITPEMHQRHIERMQEALVDRAQEHGLDETDVEALGAEAPETTPEGDYYPIKPGYAPMRPAEGIKRIEPGLISRILPQRMRVQPGFRRTKFRESLNPDVIRQENTYSRRLGMYSKYSTGESMTSGSFRTDARAYLETASNMIHDVLDNEYKEGRLESFGVRDEEGNLRRFRTSGEMQAELGPGYVLVYPKAARAFIHSELDLVDELKNAIEHDQLGPNAISMKELDNLDTGMPREELVNELSEILDRVADAHAQAYVKTVWESFRQQGIAVPSEIANYDHSLLTVGRPYNNPAGRLLARMMHRWRTLILTYMPRWALNTAVGSFLLNTVRGVGPRDYMLANRLRRMYVSRDTGEVVMRPNLIQRMRGRPDLDLTDFEPALPTGVRLGHENFQDIAEGANQGFGGKPVTDSPWRNEARAYAEAMQPRYPTAALMRGVSNIEDFFRQAAFVKNAMRERELARVHEGRDVDFEHSIVDENEPQAVPEESVPTDQPIEIHGELNHPRPEIWQPEEAAVAVDPAFRRQGIASTLMRAAMQDGLDVLSTGRETFTPEGAELSRSLGRELPDEPPPAERTPSFREILHSTQAGDGPPGVSREKYFENGDPSLPRHDFWTYVYRDENGTPVGALEVYAPYLKKTPEAEEAVASASSPAVDSVMDDLPADKLENLDTALDTLRESMATQLGHGGRGQSIVDVIEDPKLTQRAINETNKLAYSYSVMGPFERRYVRQLVPFWGWYKFISQLAYRMPVELPGRTNLLNAISLIGQQQENQYGPIPEWLRGMIPLGVDKNGKLKYFSTMGINPFASFFNPMAPGKSLQGIVQLGQLNPAAQAGLAAFGFDTLTGDTSAISPEENLYRAFNGALVNSQGEEVAPSAAAPIRRGLMTLLRSVPEYRLSEKYFIDRGGSEYPESVPFIPGLYRPRSAGGSANPQLDYALGITGAGQKTFDLKKYQELRAKQAKAAKTGIPNAKKKLRKKLKGG